MELTHLCQEIIKQDGEQGLGKVEFLFLWYSGDRNCNPEAQLHFCDCVSDPGSFHCYGDCEANQAVMTKLVTLTRKPRRSQQVNT